MKRAILLFSITFTLFLSCQEDDTPNIEITPEYLVFGQFPGGMDQSDVQMYKVTFSELEKDEMPNPFHGLEYRFTAEEQLSQGDFSNARQLIDLIPRELIDTDQNTYGCPDCVDQGGYFVEFGDGENFKRLLIDYNNTEDQSEEVIAFKQVIQTILLVIDN